MYVGGNLRWVPLIKMFCIVSFLQLNLSTTATLGTEESGRCREDGTRVDVCTVRQKKKENGRCRKVAVSGGLTVFKRNYYRKF